MMGDPIIPRVAGALEARAPRDDVAYLHELARFVLVSATAIAVVVYVARGGRLTRLAPTG